MIVTVLDLHVVVIVWLTARAQHHQTGEALVNEMNSLIWAWALPPNPTTIKVSKHLPSISVLIPSCTYNKQFMNWLVSTNHVFICVPGNIFQNIYSNTVCKSKYWKHPKCISIVECINALWYVHMVIYHKTEKINHSSIHQHK